MTAMERERQIELEFRGVQGMFTEVVERSLICSRNYRWEHWSGVVLVYSDGNACAHTEHIISNFGACPEAARAFKLTGLYHKAHLVSHFQIS